MASFSEAGLSRAVLEVEESFTSPFHFVYLKKCVCTPRDCLECVCVCGGVTDPLFFLPYSSLYFPSRVSVYPLSKFREEVECPDVEARLQRLRGGCSAPGVQWVRVGRVASRGGRGSLTGLGTSPRACGVKRRRGF